MLEQFDTVTKRCSQVITEHYSTSFTMGIKTLASRHHPAIFAIYGFVRLADEIVDTFHAFDQEALLSDFERRTHDAIQQRISLNPVLHAFQDVVHQYQIEGELIDAFLYSMRMDLSPRVYDVETYRQYIYGSAEVVGLMCLRVFCEGNARQYEQLKAPAIRLGAAFQKINFLRDIRSDYEERGRVYFPSVDYHQFRDQDKQKIEEDIQADFDAALLGIRRLPKSCKMGVFLAYTYYIKLFQKIKKLPASTIAQQRIRIPNTQKFWLLFTNSIRFYFGI